MPVTVIPGWCRCCDKNPTLPGHAMCELCRNGGEAAEQHAYWTQLAIWLRFAERVPTSGHIH